MEELRTHDRCMHFGYNKCPHKNEEIMKQATQTLPEYHGGKISIMSFPGNQEVDKICGDCNRFTSK
jgi:hypothetical protein